MAKKVEINPQQLGLHLPIRISHPHLQQYSLQNHDRTSSTPALTQNYFKIEQKVDLNE